MLCRQDWQGWSKKAVPKEGKVLEAVDVTVVTRTPTVPPQLLEELAEAASIAYRGLRKRIFGLDTQSKYPTEQNLKAAQHFRHKKAASFLLHCESHRGRFAASAKPGSQPRAREPRTSALKLIQVL